MRDEDDGKGQTFIAQQDVAPLTERNKAVQNHWDGYTKSKDFRFAGTIPATVRLKWLTEEGWDCLSPDPGCARKLAQKLQALEAERAERQKTLALPVISEK